MNINRNIKDKYFKVGRLLAILTFWCMVISSAIGQDSSVEQDSLKMESDSLAAISDTSEIKVDLKDLEGVTFVMQKDRFSAFEFVNIQILSWLQFSIIAFVCALLFFLLGRFHLFRKLAKERSIGFRMFLYILILVLVVSFELVRPFYHLLFLIVVFGLFFKNIVSYSRALFSLYFSNVKFGDKISIGDETGILSDMNFGGLHLLTNENKVYFPFNMWKEKKIILESESGTVLVSFECKDFMERSEIQSLNDLKKNLFNYPFLAVSDVMIEKEADVFSVTARISNIRYKSGLKNHIEKAGFRINRNKN